MIKRKDYTITRVWKCYEKMVAAYYTIEATMLMPMLLLVLFFLMYAGMFQYNRCIVEQGTKQVLLRASNEKMEESELYVQLLEKCTLPFLTCISVDLEVGENEARATYLGGQRTILGGITKNSIFDFFLIKAEHTTELYKPVKFIRNIRRVEKYVENGFCE